MSGPWFQRYATFGYRPTTSQGRFVIGVMALVAIPGGIFWLSNADAHPRAALVAAAAALLAALVGHMIVLWKMDWNSRA